MYSLTIKDHERSMLGSGGFRATDSQINRANRSRLRALFAGLMAVSACTLPDRGDLKITADNLGAESTRAALDLDAIEQGAYRVALVPESNLKALSKQLDQEAIANSAALYDVVSTRARRQSVKYEQWPQLVPSASTSLNKPGETALGLSLEQKVWDWGNRRARLKDIDLVTSRLEVESWRERNEKVFEGLRAYLQLIRHQDRLVILEELDERFRLLAELIASRTSGGIADRGETIKIELAQQKLRRDKISDEAGFRQAGSELRRLLPPDSIVSAHLTVSDVFDQCVRLQPITAAPDEKLAVLQVERAKLSEKMQRFESYPSLVLAAGTRLNNANLSSPTIGLRLDSASGLGLGRRERLKAAAADIKSAETKLDTVRDQLELDIDVLLAEYSNLQLRLKQLEIIKQQNLKTIELFQEQIKVGSISLVDGIALFREGADTRTSLVDIKTDIILNCLRASKLNGQLVAFGVDNA